MKKKRMEHVKHVVTKRKLREWRNGYLFILPWLVGVSVFFLYSMYRSLMFATHNVIISKGLKLLPLEHFWDNFTYIFSHETNYIFQLQSFAMSLVLKVPMIVTFALLIALLLNGRFKGRGFYRMIFFLPVIIATGPVMQNLSSEGVSGVSIYSISSLSNLLSQLPEPIFQTISDLFASLISILWQSGIQMLIFLAGLQKVSPSMYEAAKIDGASSWESFWKITIPTIKPMVLLNAIYTIIFISSDGSGAIITSIKNATYSVDLGYSYAMAMAWMYALIIALSLLIAFLILRGKSEKNIRYDQKRIVMKGVVK